MSSSRRMLLAFLLNLSFSVMEVVFGLAFRSSAVLADALHDAGDALAIGSAVFLEKYAERSADDVYTLGYKRFSILGSVITAVILLSGSVFVLVENVPKLWSPEKVNHQGMFFLGIVAIIVNLFANRLVSHKHSHGDKHHHGNHNERVLSLHFLEDILGWLAVILVSLVIPVTNWYFLDPLLSIVIALFISSKTLPEFISALKILLNAKPDGLDLQALKEEILKVQHVTNVSHLSVIAMSNNDNWAMIKLEVDKSCQPVQLRDCLHQLLLKQGIDQSTIEVCEMG